MSDDWGNDFFKAVMDDWKPIKTAPRTGRVKILIKTPYSPDGCIAYSNTWWTAGFSIECKPTHWKLYGDGDE